MKTLKVVKISGDANFASFLQSHNIAIGTIIKELPSSGLFGLKRILVGSKMLCLRKKDYALIVCQPYQNA